MSALLRSWLNKNKIHFLQKGMLIMLGIIALLIINSQIAFGQHQTSPTVWDPATTDSQYESRKQQLVQPQGTPIQNTTNKAAVARPACFEPFSNTGQDGWQQVPRNDDGSFGPIALGFNFSLFGTVYNNAYINTNGNITFDGPLEQYSALGFPVSIPMIAPFWADVDTRAPESGAIWYKVFADRLVVTWDHVGYYDEQVDKTNTFQLTIKANTAPGFSGNDVIFAYDDMQWTTGEASSGIQGFSGIPATVGANRGNNTDYIQTGRFNINSAAAPNNPTAGSPGGIDWLDGQCLGYQVGSVSGNVPPAVAGLPFNNQLILNQGETQILSLQFSGPETNQNVSITPILNGLCNTTATVANNNNSNPTVTFAATGSSCNIGTSTVVFTATDTGTPSASQSFTLTVVVNPPAPLTNVAPSAPVIANQIGTVGITYNQTLPAFTDPNPGQLLTYTLLGLPDGLSFVAGTLAISGTPSLSGVYSVTATATDIATDNLTGGLSANTVFTITINPAGTGPQPLQFVAPTYNCQTGAFTFNTTGGDGSPITFWAIGITGPISSNTNSLTDDVDGQLAQDIRDGRPNVEALQLHATQSGTTITYSWNALAACSSTTLTPSPPTTAVPGCGSPANTIGQPLQLVTPTYNCSTGLIQFNTTGGDGSPITFFAIGITSPTTSCTSLLDIGNTDNNTYTISASQNGVTHVLTWTRPCASLREAIGGAAKELMVVVKGNPTASDMVEVMIQGIEGKVVQVITTDLQGNIIHEQKVDDPGITENIRMRLGRSGGIYIIKAITSTQIRSIKVLKH